MGAMRYFIIFILLLGCSQKNPNWRVPNNDSTVAVHATKSPRCIQLLLKLSDPDKFRYIVTPEMLAEAGIEKGPIKFIKTRQADDLDFMYHEAVRTRKLQNKAENELYTLTKKYTKRFKNGYSDYVKKTYGVDYEHKFGYYFDPTKNTTRFAAPAEPGIIQEMEISIYNGAAPLEVNLIKRAPMEYIENEGRWVVDIPGDMEGKWYRYKGTAAKGATTQYGETPPQFSYKPDQYALKAPSTKGTSQVYYLPHPSLRPESPPKLKGSATWEFDIMTATPPDINPEHWGTTLAVTRSSEMKRLLSHFDELEIMPVRSAVMFENIGDNTLYLHNWHYMGKDLGFSERAGGIEGIVDLTDSLHSMGLRIRHDEVFQHTANSYKPIEFFYENPHMKYDITGCGNTLNLAPGTTLEQGHMQALKRNVFLVKIDAARFDLGGAIDKRTFQNMNDVLYRGGKGSSAEGYGFGGGWNIFDHADGTPKIIGDEWGPIGNAGIWDAIGREQLRDCAKYPCTAYQLKRHLSGGNPDPSVRYWKQKSSDAVTYIESHDGPTAAEVLVSHQQAINGEYQALAQANSFLITAQGDIMFGPMQLSALRHSELNDTPFNYFKMEAHRRKFQEEFLLPSLKLRKKFRAYFTWDWENTISEAQRISYLPEPNQYSWGRHFKKPPPDFTGPAPKEELLVLHNTGNSPVTFGIPEGKWRTILDSNAMKVDLNGSLYPYASNHYTVPPKTNVILTLPKQ